VSDLNKMVALIRAAAAKLPETGDAEWRSHDNSGMRYPESSDTCGGETDAKLPQSHVLVPVDVALAAGRKLALIGQIYDGDKESRRLSDELLRAAQEERK
jgi:hypothetical protein